MAEALKVMRQAVILAFVSLLLGSPALAQGRSELAQNTPVAIVALTHGQAEIKHVKGDWRPVYWLDLLRPEDKIRTAADGKVVATFFFDDHMEIVGDNTEARVEFHDLTRTSSGGRVRADRPRDRSVTEIPIPYMLMRQLHNADFRYADAPSAMTDEDVYLKAHVEADTDPPIFSWANTGAASYKLQLFNVWDEFIYEKTLRGIRFKLPYGGPFHLAKNSRYSWQVTDNAGNLVVRKYAFVLQTLFLSRQIKRAERHFARLKAAGKLLETNYTDMFLLYVQRKMVDKYLPLLQQMSDRVPDNPILYRALVRAYLNKGCPAHAMQARQRELQLGGVDPIRN